MWIENKCVDLNHGNEGCGNEGLESNLFTDDQWERQLVLR